MTELENENSTVYKGRLLTFELVDECKRKFSKNCVIQIPEKLPLVQDFKFEKVDSVIGSAIVHKDAIGLTCVINSNKLIRDEYYVGGCYMNVKSHMEDDICVIDSCKLWSVSIVFDPSDRSAKIKKWRL